MNRFGNPKGLFRFPLFFLLLVVVLSQVYPDYSPESRGDSVAAERYAQWAKNAIDQGRWEEALSALERASDFSGVSSDISYLLGLARSHENKPRGAVLEALGRALELNRWNLFSPDEARLLRVENLIALKAEAEIFRELSRVKLSPHMAELTLRALRQFRPPEFRSYLADTLDRYPRESGPVRIFFDYLKAEDFARRNPSGADRQLLDLIFRRLPALLLVDRELAWMAAPFMRDTSEATRLVSAYRAINKPVPASLPSAVRLGVIDGEQALKELFAFSGEAFLDRALLDELWKLLGREEERTVFKRNLSVYTGVITEDADGDGIPETSVTYHRGMPLVYRYDADQDGLPELTAEFEAGEPRRALVFIPADAALSGQIFVPKEDGLRRAALQWEQYPSVLETELDGTRYIPRPKEFYFAPFRFAEFWDRGLLFPERELQNPPLTRRTLVFSAFQVIRPSAEFEGALEIVELNRGIPLRAREYLGDRMISETDFLQGRPHLQRADLDFDGSLETVRHFRQLHKPIEPEDLLDYKWDIDYADSDWNGDGIFETRQYNPDK
jgi:hypothetical protein